MLVHFSKGQKCHKQQQKQFLASQKLTHFYSEYLISLLSPEYLLPSLDNDWGGVKEDPTWQRENQGRRECGGV